MYRGVITHNTILSIFGRYKINIIVQFEYKLLSEEQPFFHHKNCEVKILMSWYLHLNDKLNPNMYWDLKGEIHTIQSTQNLILFMAQS